MADELGGDVDAVKEINTFDHAFLKNRMMSSSSSTSIFKHTRTNSVLNFGTAFSTNATFHKRSYSTTNFQT
jgi:hypothetical protein